MAYGGGVKALADMSAKTVSFFWTTPLRTQSISQQMKWIVYLGSTPTLHYNAINFSVFLSSFTSFGYYFYAAGPDLFSLNSQKGHLTCIFSNLPGAFKIIIITLKHNMPFSNTSDFHSVYIGTIPRFIKLGENWIFGIISCS